MGQSRSGTVPSRRLTATHFLVGSTAAVDGDRQVEEHLISLRKLLLQPGQHESGTRGRLEESRFDVGDRRQLGQLGLERAWETAAAEVPAVELLQEAGGTVLAELAHGLSHEQDQLGDDLLA